MPGVIAEALRTELESLTEGQAKKRTTTGFLDAIRAPENGGTQIQVDRGNGKSRTQKIKYMPKRASTVTSSRPADCEYTDESGYETDLVELSLFTGNGFLVDEEYVQKILEGNAQYILDTILLKFDDNARDINTKIQAVAAAGFGVNQATGNTNAKTINLLDASNDNATRVSGYYEFLRSDLQQSNYFRGTPIVVGQGNFDRFVMNQGWSCCNDAGFDLARVGAAGNVSYFRDQQVEDSLADDQCFVWEPGSLKWLTFHRYAHLRNAASVFQDNGAYGGFQMVDGWAKGVIMDPTTGLIYDLIVKPDKCGDKYHIGYELCFDLYVMPTDQVPASGDKLSGTNGLYRYQFNAV